MERFLQAALFLPETTNFSLMKKIILLAISALIFAGCTTINEGRRLHSFRKSFHYKTYRFGSEKAAKRAVAEYNKIGSVPLDRETAHALFGILWLIADKSDYSFIEADLVKATSTNENKILALGLQSIALSKMDCPGLARAHYNELKTSLSIQRLSNPNHVGVERQMMLISLIAVSLYQDDLDFAKRNADTLCTSSQLDYITPLLGAVIEAKKGNPLKAMEQLQKLSQNDKFSEPKKKLFSESADMIKDCPEEELLGQELVDRLILQLVKGALDDIFSDENQQAFLKNVMIFAKPFTVEK
jgi:hypothetical protein